MLGQTAQADRHLDLSRKGTIGLSGRLSFYFDLIRPLAALVVVLHHTWPVVFPQWPLPWPGHQAVVVFFVLSGYVIADAMQREDWRHFALNRVARISSVALPAVALSLLAWWLIGAQAFANVVAPPAALAGVLQGALLAVTFMGQSWSLATDPAYNPAYWSLCHEVWYYVIAAVAWYARSWMRLFGLSLCVLLAGPKVLLLLPVWFLGWGVQRSGVFMGAGAAGLLFVVSLAAAALFYWFDCGRLIHAALTLLAPDAMSGLNGAYLFVGDFALGTLVACNFAAAIHWPALDNIPSAARVAARRVAGYTFSIYLYHMPLAAILWLAIGIRQPVGFFAVLGISVLTLGWVTERQLPAYRHWLRTRLFRSRA